MKSILEYDKWGNITKFKNNNFWVKQIFIDNEISEYADSDGNHWIPEYLMDNPFPLYLTDKSKHHGNDDDYYVIYNEKDNIYELIIINMNLTSDLKFENETLSGLTIKTNEYNLIISNGTTLTNSIIYGNGLILSGNNITMRYCMINNNYDADI